MPAERDPGRGDPGGGLLAGRELPGHAVTWKMHRDLCHIGPRHRLRRAESRSRGDPAGLPHPPSKLAGGSAINPLSSVAESAWLDLDEVGQ